MSLLSKLVFDLELDEASGNAIDSVGGVNCIDNNSVGTNGSGWRDFESDSLQYFSHADTPVLSPGDTDFEWECQANFESLAQSHILLRKWDGGTEYILAYDTGGIGLATNRFIWVVRKSPTLTFIAANTFGAASTGVNYHIRAKHDSVNNEIGIKVNNGAWDTTPHSVGMDSGGTFYVGHAEGSSIDMDGLMRRVRLYNALLTSDEGDFIWNGGSTRTYAEIVAAATNPRLDGHILIAPSGHS